MKDTAVEDDAARRIETYITGISTARRDSYIPMRANF